MEQAQSILQRLLAGNQNYLRTDRNPAQLGDKIRLKTASEGQHPLAAVLSCADSRVPPEHIFGAGIGELFVIRNAGSVVTPSALASVEYAVAHLHVPLVLLLAHRGCGAVKAALSEEEEPGALGALVAKVRQNIEGSETAEAAELANLRSGLSALRESPVLREKADDGTLAIVGAIYDLVSGVVTPVSEIGQTPLRN